MHIFLGDKKIGVTVGKVHGHDKNLIPYMKPELAATVKQQYRVM